MGQLAKKRGMVHFLGVWEKADQALGNYCDVWSDLQAGRLLRKPEKVGGRGLENHFLTCTHERVPHFLIQII
ncbi:hypothetical protein Mal48_23790 [Thalassoglobus polymorphus]|uniref:Uncharacterized protein n=1 Tax=Thalassoglobus polymorphus TaxID=2527994 RepID=A0A517QNH0_9PLAN|nr:hypothetical protein Mal48_23790 [Thalassoglobus polymorphus]